MSTSFTAAIPMPTRAARARGWALLRDRRVLALAIALSLCIHLALSLLPEASPPSPESTPLTATLSEMPPPPVPVAAPQAQQPAPRKRVRPPRHVLAAPPRLATTPMESAPAVEALEPSERQADAGQPAAPPAVAPAPLAEDVPAPAKGPGNGGKTLPPRIDLAYRVFLGTQGFQIGEATYRFEHADNRYRISTVGQARGLAALLLRGQGRLESRGLITANGLQPLEFSVDRFNRRGREAAQFDWESGLVSLPDNKTAALDVPTFDPLSLMWQYYFTPPQGDRLTINLATTRRVARYLVTREGRETIEWRDGTIETERWARRSEDGKTEAWAWLAPGLRYIPVKMRVSQTDRGTLEAWLDAIRVDDTGATVGRDDVVLQPSAAEASPSAASAFPAESRPGATFPTMTGQ